MRIIEKIESRERCAEAGWFAYDYLLDEALNAKTIGALRPMGNFVYLRMLARPFFKIESDYFMIKGVEGDHFFRVAVHDAHRGELKKIEEFVARVVQKDGQRETDGLKFDKD